MWWEEQLLIEGLNRRAKAEEEATKGGGGSGRGASGGQMRDDFGLFSPGLGSRAPSNYEEEVADLAASGLTVRRI